MNERHDLGAMAKDILDSNPYMTLGTADGSGRPWASRVLRARRVCEVLLGLVSRD
jgi:hypothetical protein